MIYLTRLFICNESFDRGMIIVVRQWVKNFIMLNKELSLNGLPLLEIVRSSGGYESLEEYCDKVVFNLGEDAQGLAINVIPMVFRINIQVVLVDSKNKNMSQLQMEAQEYRASNQDYKLLLDDSLQFFDDCIYLFLKTGHYDLIYNYEDFFVVDDQILQNLVRGSDGHQRESLDIGNETNEDGENEHLIEEENKERTGESNSPSQSSFNKEELRGFDEDQQMIKGGRTQSQEPQYKGGSSDFSVRSMKLYSLREAAMRSNKSTEVEMRNV